MMMTVARYGLMAAAISVPLCGLADGTSVTIVLQAVTSATPATAIAVRLHILPVTRSRLRGLASVLGHHAVVGYVCQDTAQGREQSGRRSGAGHRQSRSPSAYPPCRQPRPSSHNEITGNHCGKLRPDPAKPVLMKVCRYVSQLRQPPCGNCRGDGSKTRKVFLETRKIGLPRACAPGPAAVSPPGGG